MLSRTSGVRIAEPAITPRALWISARDGSFIIASANSHASSPNTVLPNSMKYSGNDHEPLCFNHFVNNAIGKSFWITPTDVLCWMSAAVQKRVDLKGIEYRQYLFGEFISKTYTVSLIPLCCFTYVVFRLRTRNDFPFHDFD